MRWVRAIALIVVGLVLLVPAGFEVRAAALSDSKPPAHNHYLDRTEAKYAELHQGIELHRVCTETGRWHEWPCDQIKP